MTLKKEKNPESKPQLKIKRLRIFFEDPDLTDTSDSELDAFSNKRQVQEILLAPVHHTPVKTLPKPKPKPKTTLINPNSTQAPAPATSATSNPGAPCTRPTKYKGVRLRKWGKWAAEIRNPFTSKRVWLGTFDTAEEAKAAYDSSAAKFLAEKERLKAANSVSNSNSLSNSSEITTKKPSVNKKLKKSPVLQVSVSVSSSSSSTKPETEKEARSELQSKQESKSQTAQETKSELESKSQEMKSGIPSKPEVGIQQELSIADMFAQNQDPIPDLGGLFSFESGLELDHMDQVQAGGLFEEGSLFDDLAMWDDEDEFDNDFANIDTWLNLEICAGH